MRARTQEGSKATVPETADIKLLMTSRLAWRHERLDFLRCAGRDSARDAVRERE